MDEPEKKRLRDLWHKKCPDGLAGAVFKRSLSDQLSRMTDDELADAHAKFRDFPGVTVAQCILAEQEWQRRLMNRQVRAMRRNIIIGALIGASIGLVGTLSGVWLANHLRDQTGAVRTGMATSTR